MLKNKIVKKLIKENKTLSIAESFTGGLVASNIVDVSGASKIFKGSIVSYMLEIKDKILNIPLKDTIKTDAVDEITSKKMAINVANLLESDYSISTTGISEKYDEREIQAYISFYSKEQNITITYHIKENEILKFNNNKKVNRNKMRKILIKIIFNKFYDFIIKY